MRVPKDDGLNGCAISEHRMLAKRAEAGGDDGAVLRGVEKDVPRYRRRTIEPVRIVKRSAVDPENIGKPLEFEKQLRPAGRTEIDRDLLAAAL